MTPHAPATRWQRALALGAAVALIAALIWMALGWFRGFLDPSHLTGLDDRAGWRIVRLAVLLIVAIKAAAMIRWFLIVAISGRVPHR